MLDIYKDKNWKDPSYVLVLCCLNFMQKYCSWKIVVGSIAFGRTYQIWGDRWEGCSTGGGIRTNWREIQVEKAFSQVLWPLSDGSLGRILLAHEDREIGDFCGWRWPRALGGGGTLGESTGCRFFWWSLVTIQHLRWIQRFVLIELGGLGPNFWLEVDQVLARVEDSWYVLVTQQDYLIITKSSTFTLGSTTTRMSKNTGKPNRTIVGLSPLILLHPRMIQQTTNSHQKPPASFSKVFMQ